MNADVFLMGFVAGTWATCLTIIAVLEIRAKMSAAQKGKVMSDLQKEKISATLKGRKMSDETKRKMSEARKKLWEQKRNEK